MREEKICLTIVLPDEVETENVVAMLRGRALPFTENVWVADVAIGCGETTNVVDEPVNMDALFTDVEEAEANADAGLDELT